MQKVSPEFSKFPLLSEVEGSGLGGKKAVPIFGYRFSIINHQLKTKANRNFYYTVISRVIIIFIKFR